MGYQSVSRKAGLTEKGEKVKHLMTVNSTIQRETLTHTFKKLKKLLGGINGKIQAGIFQSKVKRKKMVQHIQRNAQKINNC